MSVEATGAAVKVCRVRATGSRRFRYTTQGCLGDKRRFNQQNRPDHGPVPVAPVPTQGTGGGSRHHLRDVGTIPRGCHAEAPFIGLIGRNRLRRQFCPASVVTLIPVRTTCGPALAAPRGCLWST